jgi:hypothetical protein
MPFQSRCQPNRWTTHEESPSAFWPLRKTPCENQTRRQRKSLQFLPVWSMLIHWSFKYTC